MKKWNCNSSLTGKSSSKSVFQGSSRLRSYFNHTAFTEFLKTLEATKPRCSVFVCVAMMPLHFMTRGTADLTRSINLLFAPIADKMLKAFCTATMDLKKFVVVILSFFPFSISFEVFDANLLRRSYPYFIHNTAFGHFSFQRS